MGQHLRYGDVHNDDATVTDDEHSGTYLVTWFESRLLIAVKNMRGRLWAALFLCRI